jgi:hypothetical protein
MESNTPTSERKAREMHTNYARCSDACLTSRVVAAYELLMVITVEYWWVQYH